MLLSYAYEVEHLSLAGDAAGDAANIIWYDLISPSAAERRLVETLLGIEIPTHDEMAEIELSARLYQEDDAEFMTATILTSLDSDDPVKSPITFILKGQTLVTVRYVEPKSFSVFAMRAQKTNGIVHASGQSVMLGLLEAVIDRMADLLERLGDGIDGISREVFRSKNPNVTKKTRDLRSLIERIGNKGDQLTMAQESLVSISRLVAYHTSIDMPERSHSKEIRQRLKLLQRDAGSLGEHAGFLSGKINFLLDATLGLINLEQNQIIKIFSVAAVIFLPPTLVASIYGMNFENMPELQWRFGYVFAIGMMILSALMPFLYFKHRGWL